MQCYLPDGFLFGGKKSKSLSFQDPEDNKSSRSTTRTKDAAILGVQTWAWQWYRSLTAIQQAALQETEAVVKEPASKKARVK